MPTLTNRKQNSGFTLAELLVVVAIIGVLVAVSIPIFTGQIKKTKIATVRANIHAAKSAAYNKFLTEGFTRPSDDFGYYVYNVSDGTISFYGSKSNKAWINNLGVKYPNPDSDKYIYKYIFVFIKLPGVADLKPDIQTSPYYDTKKQDIYYSPSTAYGGGN